MQQLCANFGTDMRSTEAILMARFVDRAHLPLDPRTVRAIAYSIYEIDPFRRGVRRLVADHDEVALDIGQVIYDSLRTDAIWVVDQIGYNFCHRIQFSNFPDSLPGPGKHYEARYWVTLTTGDTTVVCFRLRVN
jgi:hypothetical protein